MDHLMRRQLMLPVIVFVLIAIVGAIGSAQARDGGDGDRGGPSASDPERYVLDYVPLRGDAGDMAVRSIIIRHQGKSYTLDATRGVTAETQDRIPIARLPIFGNVFGPPYLRENFSEQHLVGEVRCDDERLIVDLAASAVLPKEVIVLNRSNSYTLRARPDEKKSGPHGDVPFVGTQFGQAYFHQEENNLLILIKPSLITDSSIFH
jgi:hypothetical protein